MIKKTYITIIIISVVLLAGGVLVLRKSKTVSLKKEAVVNEVIEEKADEKTKEEEGVEKNEEAAVVPEEEIINEKEIPKANENVIEEKKDMKAVEEKNSDQEEKNSSAFEIKNRLVSFGYQKASGRKIDTIIIHSSYNSLGGDEYSVDKILNIYKGYGVAAHYIIDRKGNTYRLVEEKNIAYHAGESKVPDGRTGVNAFSIGIEMVNTKTDEYTSAQYDALKKLMKDIKARYDIKYTLGHNQIAPGRKDDPWNFDWDKI